MLTIYNPIVITGATAGGKTSVASHLAKKIQAEVISADSRQIYRGMDIGTGKDIEDYTVDEYEVPYHLIDIVDAGYKYNVYEYRKDFYKVFSDIKTRGKISIVCGGTGLYLEAILRNYDLVEVPVNEDLRQKLQDLDISELEKILKSYKKMHNRSDLDTTKRAIRAIEIAEYYSRNQYKQDNIPKMNPIVFGILYDRDTRRARITERLRHRLENGMIDEVKNLIDSGISHENLEYYGLEYKFLSWYLSGKISYNELFTQLNTAIHRFSKRQMTWFRKMEKGGIKIHWIDGTLAMEEKVREINRLTGNII